MGELNCPMCNRDVTVEDGAFGVHYNSGLLQCPNSRQQAETSPVPAEPPKPRKAPAKRKKT